MPDLDSLTNYRQGHLWPPIHSALDVYVRRKAGGAEPYELVWRLIHVWECTTIMLASAAIAKIRSQKEQQSHLDRALRERLFGYSPNEADGKLEKVGAGALDGSIDKWKEILWRISSEPPADSAFLESLCRFLNSTEPAQIPEAIPQSSQKPSRPTKVSLDPLITEWRKACDIPESVLCGEQEVKQALAGINSFRNRFAHVPFPAHRMPEIHAAFESITEVFFRCAGDGKESCLCGGVQNKANRIQGGGPVTVPTDARCTVTSFQWGQKNPRTAAAESWSALPFVLLDEMANVYLLTRLKSLDAGWWEYTRYFSEGDTVRTKEDRSYFDALPIPVAAEYAEPKAATELSAETPLRNPDPNQPDAQVGTIETPPIRQNEPLVEQPSGDDQNIRHRECLSYYDALDAIKDREYAPAIEFLEKLIRERPAYHVAWQRLGYAQREYAMALWNQNEKDPRISELLEKSLISFEHAVQHVDLEYQAEAHYHLSKSLHRLSQVEQNPEREKQALHEAETAARISGSSKFVSWCEYLESASRGKVAGI